MPSAKVVITGASSGIGHALAIEYARRGAALGLIARRTERLEQLADTLHRQYGIEVYVTPLDIRDTDSIAPVLRHLHAQMQGLDTVVVNAGISARHSTGIGEFAKDKDVILTNLVGAMGTVDAAATLMREQGHGHIVGISSFSAYQPLPYFAAYTASKAGFTSYLNAVRMELKALGIQVSAIHPGFVRTDILPDIGDYPFAAPADKVAREIADAISRKQANAIVPRMPWNLARRSMSLFPGVVTEKLLTVYMESSQ